MTRFHHLGLCFVASALVLTGTLAAQSASTAPKPSAVKAPHTLTLHLDADQTTVDCTIGELLHKVHGSFKINAGELIADPQAGLAQGEVEIDTASFTTGDAKRDARWKQDVLESSRYPAIIFHPTNIQGLKPGDGAQTLLAKGTLTLQGRDHPVELTLALEVSGHAATVTTHFVIPYVQWGLKNPSSGLTHYDKEVTVDISGKGTLEVPETSAPQ